jgi:hypothetical protein
MIKPPNTGTPGEDGLETIPFHQLADVEYT